ncbi:MAG: rRNA maturation RNase YbeY [Myxococcales bacterium]|nr:rRNA maturation RNase YbeY [Myxococcales bacterium]USN50291.1 MAG: rRNA maturation RNase YbeY [Myxococcales bacterium]
MKIDIIGIEEINKKNRKTVQEIVAKVLNAAGLENHELNVCFVDESSMMELHHQFKKKKKVTDVLSFPLPAEEASFAHTQNILGDVVICVQQAQLQAEQFGHTLEEEVAVLCAHGLFHLLGLDHEVSEEEADIQMQGEMYLLEVAGLRPELSLIGRT